MICVHLSAHITRICESEYQQNKVVILKAHSFETPKDSVRKGQIIEYESLANVLKTEIQKFAPGIKSIGFLLGYDSMEVISFINNTNNYDEAYAQMGRSFKSANDIDVISDCRLVNEMTIRGRQFYAYHCLSIRKAILDQYIKLSKLLGIKIEAIVPMFYGMTETIKSDIPEQSTLVCIDDDLVVRAHFREGQTVSADVKKTAIGNIYNSVLKRCVGIKYADILNRLYELRHVKYENAAGTYRAEYQWLSTTICIDAYYVSHRASIHAQYCFPYLNNFINVNYSDYEAINTRVLDSVYLTGTAKRFYNTGELVPCVNTQNAVDVIVKSIPKNHISATDSNLVDEYILSACACNPNANILNMPRFQKYCTPKSTWERIKEVLIDYWNEH